MKIGLVGSRWLIGVLASIGFGLCGSAQDVEGEDMVAKWDALVERLESENFAERESALKDLMELPLSALPWVEKRRAMLNVDTQPEPYWRLAQVLQNLWRQQELVEVKNGRPISVDLGETTAANVLDRIEEVVGSLRYRGEAWEWQTDVERSAYRFHGRYWDAIDAFVKAFPPAFNEEHWERFKEMGNRQGRFDKWNYEDLAAIQAGVPQANVGLLRIRHRFSQIQRQNEKEHFILALDANVEPCYEVSSMELTVRIKFGDGTILDPTDPVKEEDFRWHFTLDERLRAGASFDVEIHARSEVRRRRWLESRLPTILDREVPLDRYLKFALTKRDGRTIRIEFRGKGAQPGDIASYSSADKKWFFVDADGQKLEFDVHDTGYGAGGNGWSKVYEGALKAGEPTSLRVYLTDRPADAQEAEFNCTLEGLSVPGVVPKSR